ncbi:hypothetical protein BV898_10463 [Hypsibius exemplaris]|uniref:Uncharacterized protein n=1 Tax=Hypsibius exemplaris TaxID=2072580 RepID=A0A1W0WJL5_HYPEX|nr:hypothetical protein BV898_10463 [Hypsibius exemplaris]
MPEEDVIAPSNAKTKRSANGEGKAKKKLKRDIEQKKDLALLEEVGSEKETEEEQMLREEAEQHRLDKPGGQPAAAAAGGPGVTGEATASGGGGALRTPVALAGSAGGGHTAVVVEDRFKRKGLADRLLNSKLAAEKEIHREEIRIRAETTKLELDEKREDRFLRQQALDFEKEKHDKDYKLQMARLQMEADERRRDVLIPVISNTPRGKRQRVPLQHGDLDISFTSP